MSVAQTVQPLVGFDHGLTDPGAIGCATRRGAGIDYLIKGAIDGNIEWGSADNLLQGAPNMQLIRADHTTRIR